MFVTARTAAWRELIEELDDALRAVGVDAAATDEALVIDGITVVPIPSTLSPLKITCSSPFSARR